MKHPPTGLNTYHLRTVVDSGYVYSVEPERKRVTIGGDHNCAGVWLRTPEQVESWVAEVQALVPHWRIRAERAR